MLTATSDLFSRLTAVDHLLAALDRTARGKRRRPDVSWFLLRREPAVAALARALADGRWRPAGFDLLRLREPKRRIIARAPFADRVVHTALVDLIAPVFDRSLMPEDFACRPAFGQHRAVLRALGLMRRLAGFATSMCARSSRASTSMRCASCSPIASRMSACSGSST